MESRRNAARPTAEVLKVREGWQHGGVLPPAFKENGLAMKPCIACNQPNSSPSATVPQLCNRCWWKLPAATRSAYQHGQLKVERLPGLLRAKMGSVLAYGGGKSRQVAKPGWLRKRQSTTPKP